ncbi:hypothetical protein CDAR_478881 [Caerostris darwini]|uniref:Uncharacterized protein n=1 Tax=Caerostris darwini TaxID=1538125 RepID=A0AAV4RPY6_9ARAC|nr:hypothetical protein CDAR_478881 [Caerostris darwini]
MRHCLRIVHQRAIEPHKCDDIKTLSRLQQKSRFKRNVMRPICEDHPGHLNNGTSLLVDRQRISENSVFKRKLQCLGKAEITSVGFKEKGILSVVLSKRWWEKWAYLGYCSFCCFSALE